MAKLVDILAREWTVWPDCISGVHRNCGGWAYGGSLNPELKPKFPVCEDLPHNSGLVTRAEWQAARDALVADECAHSYRNAQGCPECGVAFAQPSWNGEGLPPVGVVCEHKRVNEWLKVEVFAVKPNYNDSHTALFTFDNGTWAGCAEPSLFRPIRTAEQIAADEREAAIEEMAAIAHIPGSPLMTKREVAVLLYDAGYRKQVDE